MGRFVEGEDRRQSFLLPQSLADYVAEDNPVRVIEVFIDELDLGGLGFAGVHPAATGRPAYHPSTLLKIYLYGYLNRLQSSRRLEREAGRNIELMWLTGRLAPDFKTIANFRRDNGAAIRAVCGQFIELCRRLKLFTKAIVAIDGSKFKAVNNRDKNYTVTKVAKRMEQVGRSGLLQRGAGACVRGNGHSALRSQDGYLKRNQTRFLHAVRLHLRCRARSLHLPGRRKTHAEQSAAESTRRSSRVPPLIGLLHLRSKTQVHARQAQADQALEARRRAR